MEAKQDILNLTVLTVLEERLILMETTHLDDEVSIGEIILLMMSHSQVVSRGAEERSN